MFLKHLKKYPVPLLYSKNKIKKKYISALYFHKNNKKIYSRLVEINGNTLKYASNKIKNDRTICINALLSNIEAYEYVGHKLKVDINFLSIIMEINPLYIFDYLDDITMMQIQNHNLFMMPLIIRQPKCIQYSSHILQSIYYLQSYIPINYDYDKIKNRLWKTNNNIGKELIEHFYDPKNISQWKHLKLDS